MSNKKCSLCETPIITSTGLCNRCWELQTGIERNPDLTMKILENMCIHELEPKEGNTADDYYTDEFWYNITDGGYIDPEKLVQSKPQAIIIKSCVDIVRNFESFMDSCCMGEEE